MQQRYRRITGGSDLYDFVVAARFKVFVGEIVPGFQEQLRTTEYATTSAPDLPRR
jgi:hypothetical protein